MEHSAICREATPYSVTFVAELGPESTNRIKSWRWTCLFSINPSLPCVHAVVIVNGFQMYSFLHKELRLVLRVCLIYVLGLFHPYSHRDLTLYHRKVPTVRWQRDSDDMNSNDLALTENVTIHDWDEEAAKDEEHLLSYTDIKVLNDKIFNLIDAMGPHAVQGWRKILSYHQNVSLKRLPELAGSTSIATNETISNPNTGNLFYAGTKSQKRPGFEPPIERTGRPRDKRGGIMKSHYRLRRKNKTGRKLDSSQWYVFNVIVA